MGKSLARDEANRQAVQLTADAARDRSRRNELGQFATPPDLALDIARHVADLDCLGETVAFCDPALGTGAFYSAVLQAFGPERIRSAGGIEIDADLAQTARGLWSKHGLHVVTGDFFEDAARASCPEIPDLIVTNPPYVRHHHIAKPAKHHLSQMIEALTGTRVSGLSGLYVYYLLAATAWLRPGGVGVWLLPSEFMDVNYGEALKAYLLAHVTLLRVHQYDPHQLEFSDALVTSAVVTYLKQPPAHDHVVEFTFGGRMTDPEESHQRAFANVDSAAKWTQYCSGGSSHESPRGPSDLVMGDLFDASRGIVTGANDLFVMTRARARELSLPDRFLRPVLPSPRYVTDAVIRADETGYPLLEPQLCLLDCDLPPAEVAERYPDLWAYLSAAEELGVHRSYLLSRRDPWYRQERRDVPTYLCTYMGRAGGKNAPIRLLWNRSRAIATNVYLLLYPKEPLRRLYAKRPDLERQLFHALVSCSASAMVSNGRTYGGGLHKIEPRELLQVPLNGILDDLPELGATVLPRLF